MAGFQNQGGQGGSGGGGGLTTPTQRLTVWGHSWVAPPPFAFGASDPASPDILNNRTHPWSGNQWANVLATALGIDPRVQTQAYPIPSAGAAAASVLTWPILVPEDATIESIYFIPSAGITANGVNYRQYFVTFQLPATGTTLHAVASVNTVSVSQYQAIKVWSMNDLVGDGGVQVLGNQVGPFVPSMHALETGVTSMVNANLIWNSNVQGTGQVDPGGWLVIRFGTRLRNYGVGGSQLLCGAQNFQNGGGWNTCLSWSPWSRPNTIEVNLTASSAQNSGTLTCSPLNYPVISGTVVNFPGGGTFTLTAGQTIGGTVLTGTGPTNVGGQPAGVQGHVQQPNGLGGGTYETLPPNGLQVWCHGLNDADQVTQDTTAWGETVRAVIAKTLCPAWEYLDQGNAVTANGGGTWATTPVATPNVNTSSSALPGIYNPLLVASAVSMKQWTGTVSLSPSVTFSIGPAFEGGTVDLVVLAPAGSSVGVAGSITVDGSTPPQGAVTLNTSGVSPSTLLTSTALGTITGAGTTTITVSGATSKSMVGQLLTATPGTTTIPAGTIITSWVSATSLTVTNNIAAGTATASITHGWVPMVKRITGLSAGAHTITLTITGSDSVPNSCLVVYGLGLESQNPTTPVVWCNIARTPGQSGAQKTNAVNLNTVTNQVLAGSATAFGTPEPALPSNVLLADIDTALGQNTALFLGDGLHPNSRGHRVIAETILSAVPKFTTDQLLSR